MAYTPDVNDTTQPTDNTPAETAQAEFRAIKIALKGIGSPLVTWNANDKSADITLSAGNLIALKNANTGVFSAVRATFSKNAGKWYWEVTPLVVGGTINIGVGTILSSEALQVGGDALGWAYRNDGLKITGNVTGAFGAAFIANDVIGVALDCTTGTLQFYKNNVLQGTAYNAGIAGLNLYPMVSFNTTGDDVIANFGQSAFVYTPPTGFTAIGTLTSGVTSVPGNVRQTVLQGLLSAGQPALFAAGAGLNVDLKATTLACYFAFAAGFGSSGAIDYTESVAADAASYWAAVAASNTTYLNITRNGPGSLTAGQTLAPFQWADTYDQTKQALLQFTGAAGSTVFLDDFGNTWTAQAGAKVQATQFKFGTGGLGGAGGANALNGTTDMLRNTTITNLGQGSWSLRCWAYITSLAAINFLVDATNAAVFGAQIQVSAAGKVGYTLSSTGAANDIANNPVAGAATITVNTWHFYELTYDALAGVYRMYVDGTQDQSTASALKVHASITKVNIGGLSSNLTGCVGYIDGFEFLPYCNHPAGTAYAVPTGKSLITTPGYSSDWFDTSQGLSKTPSVASIAAGSNPTFTSSNKLYTGEIDTSGAAVTAVRPYAYRRKYHSAWTNPVGAAAQIVSVNHNIGNDQFEPFVEIRCRITDAGYSPGDALTLIGSNGNQVGYNVKKTRLSSGFNILNTNQLGVIHKTTNVITAISLTAWEYRVNAYGVD